ncbi:Alpha/Beta hydrolase protein [Suillus clintonianus]|uniref:Alpha/Beta hydrolase protein n=1 Tax=Suillus clintonianus TaxID=1904413 RepID=UPI001B860A9D|nr:Alpha/Beta hydrolase protein [Suillus clintonianus]KAG2125788.1 Alpha/Beta hydrolase protein [Suillus clintonianus]
MSKVSKFVTSSDDCQIFAEGIGNLDGPTVVLIHGLGLSTVVFNNLFGDDQLLSKIYLVRYDMRGHGRSGKHPKKIDYSSRKFAEDFVAVTKEFERQKPYLLGWSLGGTVAVDVCTYCPGYLSGIIYVSALPYIGKIMEVLTKESLINLRPRLVSPDAADAEKARVEFVDSTFNELNTLNWDDRQAWVEAFRNVNAEDVKTTLTREQDPRALFAAGREGLRLLHLYGDADKQIDNAVAEEEVSQQFINKNVVVIKGGGHALFYEFQDQVVQEILAFVTK